MGAFKAPIQINDKILDDLLAKFEQDLLELSPSEDLYHEHLKEISYRLANLLSYAVNLKRPKLTLGIVGAVLDLFVAAQSSGIAAPDYHSIQLCIKQFQANKIAGPSTISLPNPEPEILSSTTPTPPPTSKQNVQPATSSSSSTTSASTLKPSSITFPKITSNPFPVISSPKSSEAPLSEPLEPSSHSLSSLQSCIPTQSSSASSNIPLALVMQSSNTENSVAVEYETSDSGHLSNINVDAGFSNPDANISVGERAKKRKFCDIDETREGEYEVLYDSEMDTQFRLNGFHSDAFPVEARQHSCDNCRKAEAKCYSFGKAIRRSCRRCSRRKLECSLIPVSVGCSTKIEHHQIDMIPHSVPNQNMPLSSIVKAEPSFTYTKFGEEISALEASVKHLQISFNELQSRIEDALTNCRKNKENMITTILRTYKKEMQRMLDEFVLKFPNMIRDALEDALHRETMLDDFLASDIPNDYSFGPCHTANNLHSAATAGLSVDVPVIAS